MKTRKTVYSIIPAILLAIVGFLLYFKGLSFDFLAYRLDSPNSHRAFLIFGAIALPLILLLVSDKAFRDEPLHSKILMIGVSSFAVSMNFYIQFIYIFSIVFTVCIAVNLYFERRLCRPTVFHILIFIYFIINLASLLWTSDWVSGIHYLKKDLSLVYVPLFFCMFSLRREQLRTILIAVGRWLMFFAFLSVCAWILESRALGLPLSESFGLTKHFLGNIVTPFAVVFSWSNFDHPTYVSIGLILGISILWYYVGKKRVTVSELVFGIVIVLFLSVITQSRFMLLAWAVTNTIFVLYSLRKRKKAMIILICISVVSVAALLRLSPNITKSLFMDDVRKMHYSAAFEAIEENTWLGTGIGGMTKYINKDNPIYTPPISTFWAGHYHPHNQAIGDLMQTGILGLLSIVSLIVYSLYASINQRNILFFSFVILYLLLMSIEMPLMVDQGLYYFVFVISLFTANRTENENYYKAIKIWKANT